MRKAEVRLLEKNEGALEFLFYILEINKLLKYYSLGGGGIQVAPTVGLCCVRHIAANSSDAHSGSRSDMRELKTKTPPSCKLTRKQDSDESIGRLPSQLL